jgi:hypothetical protein
MVMLQFEQLFFVKQGIDGKEASKVLLSLL